MKNIQPDKQKAKALAKMAEITMDRLKEFGIFKYPANALTDYYDVVHKLMESLTYIEGIKIKGEGAHQKLIDYVSKKYELGQGTQIFLQNLRDYRNRISYEGFSISENYLRDNNERIKKIIDNLFEIINNK